MAKSIADWYSGRESQSLELGSDDEYVERQEPWDLGATRSKRIYGGQTSRTLVAGRSAEARRKRSDPGQAQTSRKPPAEPVQQNWSRPQVPKADRVKIIAAVRANPGLGAKKLAARLRASGTQVTRAQVAEVLRHQGVGVASPPGSTARKRPRRPRTAIEADLRRVPPVESRVVALLPCCPACGIRVNLNGMCGCSS